MSSSSKLGPRRYATSNERILLKLHELDIIDRKIIKFNTDDTTIEDKEKFIEWIKKSQEEEKIYFCKIIKIINLKTVEFPKTNPYMPEIKIIELKENNHFAHGINMYIVFLIGGLKVKALLDNFINNIYYNHEKKLLFLSFNEKFTDTMNIFPKYLGKIESDNIKNFLSEVEYYDKETQEVEPVLKKQKREGGKSKKIIIKRKIYKNDKGKLYIKYDKNTIIYLSI